MRLKQHLSTEPGLSDLLNYAHLVDEGILINKDGAFLMSYQFRGQDLNAASGAECDALTATFNRMVTFLEDGWMLHIDEIRIPSMDYPERGAFPDPVSWLIDEERRADYESEDRGAHYENVQFITFVWKFPLPVVKTHRHWFVNEAPHSTEDNLSKLLAQFKETVARCVGLMNAHGWLQALTSSDLLSYLNTCITGNIRSVAVPPDHAFIDVILGCYPVIGGYVPKVGDKNVTVLSITGYLNTETAFGLLEAMSAYPMVYRWSNRFIALSEATAAREMKRYQRNWNNKVKGLSGILKEAITGQSSTKINHDAQAMSEETSSALTLNSNQSTRWGYWSSEVVLMHENLDCLELAAKALTHYLEQAGFSCIKEDINALDAWLGAVPGHGSCNVRRVFINSLNLAHVLPLHTIWAGAPFSDKASLLPPQSPPVFFAATTGNTPFRFNLDVSDVGHQVILGATGSGKSTYLGFLIAQFLRYKDAQIFVFDKDYSHRALTHALGGEHYDIGNAAALAFCPLADLASDTKLLRASQFIEDLVELQGLVVTSEIRHSIFTAMRELQHVRDERRNLTVLKSIIQHDAVRAALHYYTVDGQFKLLDATRDSIQQGYLHTFEMNWLLSQKPVIYLPVLRYIFDEIESRLEKNIPSKPTLIILEEAWAYLAHEVFARKLKEWLKTLRKKNARVVFATQSLADLYDPSTQSLTATTAAILESCPTKIYLPNPVMDVEIKTLYHKMGLSDRQLEIIAHEGIPKKHYFVTTPEGNRLIDLGLHDNSLALQFIGLSPDKSAALMECMKQHQERWLERWLTQHNHPEWIKVLNENLSREVA